MSACRRRPGPDTLHVVIGNEALMVQRGVDLAPLADEIDRARNEGWTASLVAMTSAGESPMLLGLIAFSDTPRPGARAAVEALRSAGIGAVMLSGDQPAAARSIAASIGIEEAVGGLSPAGKVDWIRQARAEGRGIAMVGDGINDAPALAGADIGIAMGDGTDVAMETAAVTLMRGDPRLVPAAIDIGRRTRANLRQNLFWAFGYNVIGIPLAAAGLLSPVIAGLAMALSSICVVGNALRLSRWRPARGTTPY